MVETSAAGLDPRVSSPTPLMFRQRGTLAVAAKSSGTSRARRSMAFVAHFPHGLTCGLEHRGPVTRALFLLPQPRLPSALQLPRPGLRLADEAAEDAAFELEGIG